MVKTVLILVEKPQFMNILIQSDMIELLVDNCEIIYINH